MYRSASSLWYKVSAITYHNHAVGGDGDAPYGGGGRDVPGRARGGRVQPERLLPHLVKVGESGEVGHRYLSTTPEYLRHLLTESDQRVHMYGMINEHLNHIGRA